MNYRVIFIQHGWPFISHFCLVKVAFVVMVTMMFVMVLQTNDIDRSPQAFIATLELRANDSREDLNPLVEDLRTWVPLVSSFNPQNI